MSMVEPPSALRLAKLTKIFNQICSGQVPIGPSSAPLFLESIYLNTDPPRCLDRLVTSRGQAGLVALQASLRFDVSAAFLNGYASRICAYFASPGLEDIAGGDYVTEVIKRMVDPPIFWNALVTAFKRNNLTGDGQAALAWILLRLVSTPSTLSQIQHFPSILELANDVNIVESLLESTSPSARNHAQKLQHFIKSSIPMTDDTAGGRHDNDHFDFRDIAILPTAGELESTERPFLRTSDYLISTQPIATAETHLDNQFRLLREDMLGELRDEIQISLGQKKGRHRGLVLDQVQFVGLSVPEEGKRGRIGIQLQCQHDLWQLKALGKNAKKRKEHLINNKNILKHQSLSCVVVDGRPIAFAVINRDEDLLAKMPPIIVLETDEEDITARVLVAIKASPNIKLVQIDTAVFSYEPVLGALKDLRGFSLEEEILQWEPGVPPTAPNSLPSKIVRRITDNPGQDLASLLALKKTVELDPSQAKSLLSGLTQRVSLIQGPPGKLSVQFRLALPFSPGFSKVLGSPL